MSQKYRRLEFLSFLFFVLLLLVAACSGGGEESVYVVEPESSNNDESVYLHDYSVNTAGTIVTEDDTGVMWQQSGGWQTMTWDEANEYCEELILEEYDDWILPELDLLKGLFERDAFEYHSNDQPPYINDAFDCRIDTYWSCTSTHDGWGWGVNFSENPNNWQLMIEEHEDKSRQFYVRCVRLPEQY